MVIRDQRESLGYRRLPTGVVVFPQRNATTANQQSNGKGAQESCKSMQRTALLFPTLHYFPMMTHPCLVPLTMEFQSLPLEAKHTSSSH